MSEFLARVLDQATEPIIVRGFVQIIVAMVLVGLVLGAAKLRDFGFRREIGTAIGRGLGQILTAGAAIGVLLAGHLAWAGVVLLFMIGAAAWISHKRGPGIPGALRASALAIAVGSALVIIPMTIAGAIETSMRDLIVVGSMVIAMAMKTNSLVLDRFTGELASNRDEIEAVLSLGVPPERAISDYVSRSVYASLIPIVDRLKSLGIVSIPGMMAGMIIAGSNPIYAAQYQFVIMLMLFAAGGLTSMTSTFLASRYVFTEADQLERVPG